MPIRTGRLLRPKVYLIWKHRTPDAPDEMYTAPAGALVHWDDAKKTGTNAGYERYYGDRLLYWIDLPEYGSIGAELGIDFEWDDDVR